MSKTENDPRFIVRPRYYAVEITEEYVRSAVRTRHSSVIPKFDPRRGIPLGVDFLDSDGELTGKGAAVGEYVVFTPAGPEVYWDRGPLEARYEIEEDA